MDPEKKLVVICRTDTEANVFDKERSQEYRLSEQLSKVENAYVFIRRAKK